MTATPSPPAARTRRLPWRWALGLAGLVVLVGLVVLASRVRWTTPTIGEVESLLAARRFDAAADAARSALREQPQDTRLLFALARAQGGREDWNGVVTSLEKIPSWSIRRAEAHLITGQALRKLGYGRRAERAFLDAIARDHGSTGPGPSAKLELMKLYAAEERIDAFQAVVWDLMERVDEADRLALLTARTQIEFEQSKPEINIRQLRPLVEHDPDDHDARAGLAAALDRAGKLEEARDHYRQALAAAPQDPELRERVLDLAHRMGDMAAVRDLLAARPPGSDDRPNTAKFLGLVAEADGRLDDAALAYERAARAEPNDPEHQHRLSQVLYRLRRQAEADARTAERARLTRARDELRLAWNDFATPYEADPSTVTAAQFARLGRACEAIGWTREAAAWFRQAIRKAPDHPEAHAGLDRLQAGLP